MTRSEITKLNPQTLKMIAKHQNRQTQNFVSDNKNEYLAKPVQSCLNSNGCLHTADVTHHPEMNSVAEIINRTIMKAAEEALTHSRLPQTYWNYTIMDAANKYNLMTHKNTGHSPYPVWNQTKQTTPPIYPFRAIGTVTIRQTKNKLQPRAFPCRYLYTLNATQIMVMSLP